MPKKISLSPRLSAVARHIPAGSRVVDVGTDHGLLATWLVVEGICPRVIAADVAKDPLDAARRTADDAGVAPSITFHLADGLAGVDPDAVDTVVIAGMGGETMLGILSRAPWLFERQYRLVLAPQSKIADLLDWLIDRGVFLLDRALVEDGGKTYPIIHAMTQERGGRAMATVNDVFAHMNTLAPVAMKMEFDNVGLLVGRADAAVTGVLVALDVTDDVIREAVELHANVIVAHHPIILGGQKSITDGDVVGTKLMQLIRHDIAAICMHTNLDSAPHGVNDQLAGALGVRDTGILWPQGEHAGVPYGLGRVGMLASALDMPAFLTHVSHTLNTRGLRYHDAGRAVHRVGVMGGSGSDGLYAAVAAGCDTYLAGELKYHTFLEAKELGINLVEADHFCTENVVCPYVVDALTAKFPDVSVRLSKRHRQVVQFFSSTFA